MDEPELRDSTRVTSDEAFAAVGNQTRVEVLQVLATRGSLTFSELFERVDYDTESNFSYHLDRLREHFVRKKDEEYEITQAGLRVVEAIRSGIVTEAPVLERTPIDQRCHFCGGQVEVQYYDERLERYCSECEGMWGANEGFLGSLTLPPVGLENRTIEEATRMAWVRRNLELYSIAARLCPLCSGRLTLGLDVCADHHAAVDLCERCDHRYSATIMIQCDSCGFDSRGSVSLVILPERAFIQFLLDNDLHPVLPTSIAAYHRIVSDVEMKVESSDPPAVRLTFSVDGDRLSFRVDNELRVEVVDSDLS